MAFSYWKQSSKSHTMEIPDDAEEENSSYYLIIGIILVLMNLALDGKLLFKWYRDT